MKQEVPSSSLLGSLFFAFFCNCLIFSFLHFLKYFTCTYANLTYFPMSALQRGTFDQKIDLARSRGNELSLFQQIFYSVIPSDFEKKTKRQIFSDQKKFFFLIFFLNSYENLQVRPQIKRFYCKQNFYIVIPSDFGKKRPKHKFSQTIKNFFGQFFFLNSCENLQIRPKRCS